VPVRIYTKTYPATSYRLWRTVTTEADGRFSVPPRMVKNTAFQAVFLPGGTTYDRADSPVRSVGVRVRVVRTSPATGTAFPAGSTFFVNGYTYPAKPGVRAHLIWIRPDGVRQSIGSAVIGSNGVFRIARGALPRGTYRLYIMVPGASGNLTGYSGEFNVRIV
jgi:hypothetical protein